MNRGNILVLEDASSTLPRTAVLEEEILTLLDKTGLGFVGHTHHPGTHLSYGSAPSADPWANTRRECPDVPTALLPGWRERA